MKPMGKISMHKPNRRVLIPAIIAAIIIAAAAIYFINGNLHGNASISLSGTIESTQIDVNSEVAGKVIGIEKDEGALVKAGDVLAVLDSSMQELAVKQQEEVVKLKRAKLDELKAGSRPEQVRQAVAGVDSSKAAYQAAQAGVDTAETSYSYWLDKYNKINSLYQANAASESDAADAKLKLDTAYAQLQTAKRQSDSAKAQVSSAQAQLDQLARGSTEQTIRAAEADLAQSEAALSQAKLVLSKYRIAAPADGTYLVRNISIGDIVNIGTNIATLSDLTDLWLKVYIPQRHIHSVQLGQNVELKTPSLSGKTVKGQVIYIANEAEFTPKNVETSEAKENTVFMVKIKLMDGIALMKPGMTLSAELPVKP